MADPQKEEVFWKEEHPNQPYANEEIPYEHHAPAYRPGIDAAQHFVGRQFEEIEDTLELNYEKATAGSALPWDRPRPAVKAAWDRLSGVVCPRDVERGIRSGF